MAPDFEGSEEVFFSSREFSLLLQHPGFDAQNFRQVRAFSPSRPRNLGETFLDQT